VDGGLTAVRRSINMEVFMLRYLTSGESHGTSLVGILEGMVSALKMDMKFINNELARRQKGYGRGARMKIEKDTAEILTGVKGGKPIGSPITILVKNKDASINELPVVRCPRPGHADLAGALKYGTYDMREILERSSARETVVRVAIGSACKLFLKEFGIDIISHTRRIGKAYAETEGLSFSAIKQLSLKSSLSCADKNAEEQMIKEIDKARDDKDSLGGMFEVIAVNAPAGLGSHVEYDRKLDARLAMSLMSIQAIKGFEVGLGFGYRNKRGSEVHDEIYYSKEKFFYRKTNNAGGIEGGITNGEPIVLRCVMKPISTLMKPLKSVDVKTKKEALATVERADICAVPSAGVVAESAVAFELARAMLEKFGGDSLAETKCSYGCYVNKLKKY